jgi:hypothetical protein
MKMPKYVKSKEFGSRNLRGSDWSKEVNNKMYKFSVQNVN